MAHFSSSVQVCLLREVEVAMEKLFSVTQVADLLGGISPWTIRAWLSKGILRRTKVGGRTMVSEGELERFLTQSNLAATEGKHGHRKG